MKNYYEKFSFSKGGDIVSKFFLILVLTFFASSAFAGTWIIWCFSGNPTNCYSRWVPQNLDCVQLAAQYPRNNPDPAVGVFVADCWHANQTTGMILQEGVDSESGISYQILATNSGLVFINESTNSSSVLISQEELNNIKEGYSLYLSEQDGLIIMYTSQLDVEEMNNDIEESSNVENIRFIEVKKLLDQKSAKVKIFPNPVVNGILNFEIYSIQGASEENHNLEILDSSGKIALSCNAKIGLNSLDVSRLSSGIYTYRLKLNFGEEIESGKFVIQ